MLFFLSVNTSVPLGGNQTTAPASPRPSEAFPATTPVPGYLNVRQRPKKSKKINLDKVDYRNEQAYLYAKRRAILQNIVADTQEKEDRAAAARE